MDEARIQEIVDRVMARVGAGRCPRRRSRRCARPRPDSSRRLHLSVAPAPAGAPPRRRRPARTPRRLRRRGERRQGRAPRARGERGGAAGGAQALGGGDARHRPRARRRAGEAGGRGDRLRPRRGQAEEEPTGDRQDAGDRGAGADRVFGRRRPHRRRAGQLRRHRVDHADDQPDRDCHQQRHRHGGRRKRGGVQRPPLRGEDVGVPGASVERGDQPPRAVRRRCSAASSGRRSRAPRR